MKKTSNSEITYIDILKDLNKDKLINILDIYHLKYSKNDKKELLINLIIDNLNTIVDYTLALFQNDEYANLKLIIKKKGKIKVNFNKTLLCFLNVMKRNYLVIDLEDNTFLMPKELVLLYKAKIKSKETISLIENNTQEYNLINGYIDTYGVIDFEYFYNGYSKDYKLNKAQTLDRLNNISKFYLEFNIFKEKSNIYIASNLIKSLKDCKKYYKKDKYKYYTNEELINNYTLKCLDKTKSYHKLIKFINRNYEISKGHIKIINHFVLKPYLNEYQVNKQQADTILSALIDRYFEFNNDKHKNKFMVLFINITNDYPCWLLQGNIKERKKI